MAAQQSTPQAQETWKPLVGHEGYAEVSDMGRIRTLDRTIMRSNGIPMSVKGQIATLHPGTHGYPSVRLYKQGKAYNVYAHRAVMAAFVGPCPKGLEVCHNNGIRSDARLSNLRYGTRGENVRDSVKHGTNHWANKTHCPRGHALASPNLVPSMLKRGRRTCLACSRAQGRIYYHTHLKGQMQMVSDAYYRELHTIEEI